MTWLRELARALFDALLAHWREPRRTKVVGGTDELKAKIDTHIKLRAQEDRYGSDTKRGDR